MVLSRKWEVAAWKGGWGVGVTSCLCDEVGALVLVFVMKMLVLQNKCYILEGVDGGHELSV